MTNNEKGLSDKSVRIEYKGKYYTCSEGVQLSGINDIKNVQDISFLMGMLSVSLALIFLGGIAVGYKIKNKSNI